MIGYIFKNAINILKRKPFMLWGISLLCGVVTLAVQIAGFSVPLLTIPIVLTIEAGMSALYLDGYNGKEVNSKQLFKGFTKECCPRVTAGMLWHYLWSFIWGLVPVAGIVKSYSYAFTPYILLTKPEVSPLDALKLSMKETKGYKGKMFGANLLMGLIFVGILLLSILICIIPVIGWLVGFVGIVGSIILYPLFVGLVNAGFYEEAMSGKFKFTYPPYGQQYGAPQQPYNAPQQPYNAPQSQNADAQPQNVAPQPQSERWFCTQCGTQNDASASFCTKCGKSKSI